MKNLVHAISETRTSRYLFLNPESSNVQAEGALDKQVLNDSVNAELDGIMVDITDNISRAEATHLMDSQDENARVMGVQAMLKMEGYDIGVDGFGGNKTRGIIKEYQQSNGLDASGSWSDVTLLDSLKSSTDVVAESSDEASSNEAYIARIQDLEAAMKANGLDNNAVSNAIVSVNNIQDREVQMKALDGMIGGLNLNNSNEQIASDEEQDEALASKILEKEKELVKSMRDADQESNIAPVLNQIASVKGADRISVLGSLIEGYQRLGGVEDSSSAIASNIGGEASKS